MLRSTLPGQENTAAGAAATHGQDAGRADYPNGEEPYVLEDRPPGILFYRAKESFYLPYALLQAMRLEKDQITLSFAAEDVTVAGRGLHQLYTLLAAQRVARIVEQGQRYAALADAAVFVGKLERVPK